MVIAHDKIKRGRMREIGKMFMVDDGSERL